MPNLRSLLVLIALVLGACGEQQAVAPAQGAGSTDEVRAPLFEEIRAAGLSFEHFNGMSGELYFPEMMGAGVALLDYDGDGDLDLYFVQGHMLGPGKTLADATFAPPAGVLTDRLFRNDTQRVDGETVWRFTDVTESAGINAAGYGMGVATGDFDNDGDPDLYVTNFGANQLWRNEGEGSFVEVTSEAGVDDPRWSVSAVFVDYDADGWLDLYVGNYVDFDYDTHKPCKSTTSALDYCSPQVFESEPDSLFRNLGDGRFEAVGAVSGVGSKPGASLGVVAADFDGDERVDLYVANDGMANFLWQNQGDGTFVDGAELAGAAVNMGGSAEASMGVSADDFDADGDLDLFMTHLNRETNTLYVNDGRGWFEDRTTSSGLGEASFAYTGFGTVWFDYNLDGWSDLFIANGAVTRIEEQVLADEPYPLKQANQLFRNIGGRSFVEVSNRGGDGIAALLVSRGAAAGDLDNDGDTDLVISNNSGPAQLLSNRLSETRQDHDRAWLGVRLAGLEALSLNARVALLNEAVELRWQRVHTDGSYASASDPRRIFPLADPRASILVRWADGQEERFEGLVAGKYHTLERGQGQLQSGRELP